MKVTLKMSGSAGVRDAAAAFGGQVAGRALGAVAAETLAAEANRRLQSHGGRLGRAVVQRGGFRANGTAIEVPGASDGPVAAAAALEFGAARRRYQFSGQHVSHLRTKLGGRQSGYYVGWAAAHRADEVGEAVNRELGKIADKTF